MNQPLYTQSHNPQLIREYQHGINEISRRLQTQLDDLKNYVPDLYTTIIYYIIVIGIMSFFIYVIIADLYNIFKLHSIQNNDINIKEKDEKTFDDNYDYSSDEYQINYNENITKGFGNLNNSMSNQFSKLTEFKEKNNIDSQLYINSTVDSISSSQDNYYYPNKKSTGFWELLFNKPKHTNIVNNSQNAFISFI